MKNEILREVWDNRDRFARRCRHNLAVMGKKLQKVESRIRNPIVDRAKKTSAKHHSAV